MARQLAAIFVGAASIALGVFGAGGASAAEHEDAEQQLMQAERNWCTALVKNDSASLAAILADELVDVGPDGKISNKAQDLEEARTVKMSICEDDQMQVRVFGNAAVVVGRATIKSEPMSGLFRFTDTYVRRDGRWQCVSAAVVEIH